VTHAIEMEACGWIGGVVLISAYALVSFGKISAQGAAFQYLNLAGSLLLAANSAWHHAWPSTSVNLIWIGVGIAAVLRGRRAGRAEPLTGQAPASNCSIVTLVRKSD
jgi:hypothetical protein